MAGGSPGVRARRARVFAALSLPALCACGKRPEARAARTVSVLFVGDSLTAANDLPRVFAGVAASRGDPVSVLADAPGGAGSTAQRVLSEPAFAQKKLPSKDWDFAILQEHSELPIVFVPGQDIASSVRRLSQEIRDNDPRTRLVFLETWGFKDGDPGNCGYSPLLCTYTGMQDALLKVYAAMAGDNSGLMAPVGEAWRALRAARPDIPLYSDDHHPSRQGTYLSACVLYSVLFKKSSRGADPQGLEPGRTEVLQETADAVVFDPASAWDPLRPGAPASAR